jgi:hypothetical protein
MTLTHIIGPKTAHSYEPGAKAEVNRRIDALAADGRATPGLEVIHTRTLRYNSMRHVLIDGLEEHWKEAALALDQRKDGFYQANLTNVTAFSLRIPPGHARGTLGEPQKVVINDFAGGTPRGSFQISLPLPQSDGSLEVSFFKQNGTWVPGPPAAGTLRKKHGLQGPVDDAFMDRFLFVRPTGTAANEKAGAWAQAELARAVEQWRRQFRGDVRIKEDTQVTEDDIRDSHLVLWGDPASNAILGKVAPSLPIGWTSGEIKAGDRAFPAAHHALIAIYPNPLNPEKYVVLNSGFTFREYDQLNNARQTPKLPDWAVIDLDTPPNSRHPGRLAAADFFGEGWELKPPSS